MEANETFTVGLSVSGTSLSVTATDTGTGTINNDDSAAVTVNDASASEGDEHHLHGDAGLEGGPGRLEGDAVLHRRDRREGTDYDENTTALTFTGTKGETEDVHGVHHRGRGGGRQRDLHGGLTRLRTTSLSTTVPPTDTGHRDRKQRRQRHGDGERRERVGRRRHDLHGDAGQGGAGRPHGDAGLHRRRDRRRHGLRREHDGADLRGHDRQRDQDVHGVHHGGHGGGGRRDLHGGARRSPACPRA